MIRTSPLLSSVEWMPLTRNLAGIFSLVQSPYLQRRSSGAHWGGTLDRSGSLRTTQARISLVVPPVNRRFPESISPTSAPYDQMSDLRSVGPPNACSGDI